MSIEKHLVPVEHRANICFDCDRACGGCSWSEWDPETKRPRFKPVPGWTAKKSIVRNTATKNGKSKRVPQETYHITACPLFKPDPLGRTEQQDGTDKEYNELRTFYK